MLFVLSGNDFGNEDLAVLHVVNVASEGRALLLNNTQTCTLGKQIRSLDGGSKAVTAIAHEQEKQH